MNTQTVEMALVIIWIIELSEFDTLFRTNEKNPKWKFYSELNKKYTYISVP